MLLSDLMDHFWEIAEYLLNTLLFTLGGTVWGDVSVMLYSLSTTEGSPERVHSLYHAPRSSR